jgi:uncharacterized membrane protein
MTFGYLRTRTGRILTAIAVVITLGTVVGMVVLHPNGNRHKKEVKRQKINLDQAKVTKLTAVDCQAPQAKNCVRVSARITDGKRTGQDAVFTLGNTTADPVLHIGDRIRVVKNELPPGVDPTGVDPYAYADFERRAPLLYLAILFVVLVVAFGRWRGVGSLAGLAVSLAIVMLFVLPAILDGRSPLAVAVVGSVAVMIATIVLAHGVGPKSLAAILGTAGSLSVTVGLAVLFTHLAHLTGLSSEESTLLQANIGGVNLEGLVLAGMIIGALGVLDDVTVSQSSAVMALRRANPAQGLRWLYREALDVGHDHVAATVNTLVLAYVGASLPVLLIFTTGGTAIGDALNNESVAIQIVSTLVGSIGLIAAVPITTALAALLAVRTPAEAIPEGEGHVH